MWKKLIIVVSILACLCVVNGRASNDSKLKSVLKQISIVKHDIDRKEKQQLSVEQQLKNLKRKIWLLEASYKVVTKNLKQQKNIIKKLNNDQTGQRSKLGKIQKDFSAQMVAAYQLDKSNCFKTIFNKKDRFSSEQILIYHKYVFMARLEKMQNIKRTLARIESNKQKIKKQTKVLERLENKQKQQKHELVQNKKERSKILSLLRDNIAIQNEKLTKLIKSKKNLEKLVEHLVPIKEEVITTKLMAQLCQNFVWPTKGDVIIHFGSPIEQSSWSWSGIIISATQNQEVRAVSSGKVVYADWFNGYGLLLIIDHGSGYMSLYGHNNKFSKKVDDKVVAGEIIAFVGKSDCEESRLYFAIRYNGKPVNPEKWCK